MHVENKHKIFACQQCDFKSKGRIEVKKHITSVHKEVSFTCKQCNFTSKSNYALLQHTEVTHEGIRYVCKKCDFTACAKASNSNVTYAT